jgi:hypothetical protein
LSWWEGINWWAVALLVYSLVVLSFAIRALLHAMRRLGKPEE